MSYENDEFSLKIKLIVLVMIIISNTMIFWWMTTLPEYWKIIDVYFWSGLWSICFTINTVLTIIIGGHVLYPSNYFWDQFWACTSGLAIYFGIMFGGIALLNWVSS